MAKTKIIVFGSGSSCIRALNQINHESVLVLFIVDNDASKHGSKVFDFYVKHPEQINSVEFDIVLVASQYGIEIKNQLMKYGVECEKIIYTDINSLHKTEKEKNKKFLNLIYQASPSQGSRKKIALQYTSYSGSNTIALYQSIPDSISQIADIYLINQNQMDENSEIFDVVCNTSIKSNYSRARKTMQLWHGFPLKKIGKRTTFFYDSYPQSVANSTDIIVSYSEIYSALFNSSFPNHPDKYKITGMPRNDLLFSPLWNSIYSINPRIKGKKIIFFLPTYRVWYKDNINNGGKNNNNLFGFEDFNTSNFIAFLKQNNLHLITKIHPMEGQIPHLRNLIKYPDFFTLMSEDDFKEESIDLYNILGCADLLITDYSSVYFDFLLLNRPVIFTPVDLSLYEKKRGFNLTPYDEWTPGEKCFSQSELEKTIENQIANPSLNEGMRGRIKNIVHDYQDDQSAKRVWNEIALML